MVAGKEEEEEGVGRIWVRGSEDVVSGSRSATAWFEDFSAGACPFVLFSGAAASEVEVGCVEEEVLLELIVLKSRLAQP